MASLTVSTGIVGPAGRLLATPCGVWVRPALPSLSLAPSSSHCSLRSWGFYPKAWGKRNQFSCLVFSSSLSLGLLCPSLYVSLWVSVCLLVFPCRFLPFKPKVFKVRLWIARREAQLGNHTGISQSIHPSKSFLFSLPWLTCLMSVLLCSPLSESLCLRLAPGLLCLCSNPGPTA